MKLNVGAHDASMSEPTRRLFLRGYRCPGTSMQPERASALVVDIEMMVPLHLSASNRDDIRDVVDYDIMRQAILAAPKADLQELVSQVLQRLLGHPKVRTATVTAWLEGGNGSERVTMTSDSPLSRPS